MSVIAVGGAVGIVNVDCVGSYGVDPFVNLNPEIYPGNGLIVVPDKLPAQPTQKLAAVAVVTVVLLDLLSHLVPFK